MYLVLLLYSNKKTCLHVRLVRINILGPRNDDMYNMRMFVKHFLIRKVHMYFKYQTKGIINTTRDGKIKHAKFMRIK